MKIFWLHTHFRHLNSGGTRLVFEIATYLTNKLGHQVEFMVDTASEDSRHECEKLGIKLHEIDTTSTNSAVYWLSLPLRLIFKKNKIKKIVDRDSVIINSMFPMNILSTTLPNKRIQICFEPYAYFYDKVFLSSLSYLEKLFFKTMSKLYSHLDKESTQNMSAVITVNKTNISKFKTVYNITPDVLYVGLDSSRYFKQIKNKKIDELKKTYRGSPLLLHTTDMSGTKGTTYLLEIIKELTKEFPDIKLLITIYVNTIENKKILFKKITDLKIESNITLLGLLKVNELPIYYNLVDFVCQPSINQPSSWPLKESLLCETPIIGGVESEEVVPLKNGIRINIRDISTSSKQVAHLIRQKDTLDTYTYGREMMIENFEIKNNYSKIEKILNNL